jgi:hypothetical protein
MSEAEAMMRARRNPAAWHLARAATGCAALAAAAVLTMAPGLAAPSAPILHDNFDRTGTVIRSGQAVLVAGTVDCPAGATVTLRATISQGDGPVAAGTWTKTCTAATRSWHATAVLSDGTPFRAGCAHATGLAITRRHGKAVGAFQWLDQITLTSRHAAAPTAIC